MKKKLIGIMLASSIALLSMTSGLIAKQTGKVQKAMKAEKSRKLAETTKSIYTDPNKAIQVTKASPTFILKLRSNPTTGYSWFLADYNQNLIKPIACKYVAPSTKMMGVPGYDVWEFRVNPKAFTVPQVTEVTLQYFRHWAVFDNGRKLSFTIVINSPPEKLNL